MTVETSNALRRLLAPPMAATALMLAGCAATHVGEDWQCPLAQGARCMSVAAADPMVPLAGGGSPSGDGSLAGGGHRRAGAIPPAAPAESRPALPDPEPGRAIAAGDSTDGGQRACAALCRPFRWFARLLEADAEGGAAVDSESTNGAPEPAPGGEAAPVRNSGDTTARAAGEPARDPGARIPETVARVWIAPHVDADGVYREASWVRIVIAPAAWRTR